MRNGLLPLADADIEPIAKDAFAQDFDARHAMELSRTISLKRIADAQQSIREWVTGLFIGVLVAAFWTALT